jgi:hypothetical protein
MVQKPNNICGATGRVRELLLAYSEKPKPREKNKAFRILELTPDEIKEALVDYIRNKKRKE